MPAAIARGYETRTVQRLSLELQSRLRSATEIAAVRVEAMIKAAAAPYRDTGETETGIHVVPYGQWGRAFGLIATSETESSKWLDQGTTGGIRRPSGKLMPVGARSPDRANAPVKGIRKAYVVSGQRATHFFSAPTGPPLNQTMRNVVQSLFRRSR